MAKLIAIREDLYKKLERLKGKDKSFSDIIEEVTGKKSDLNEFIGIWSKKDSVEATKSIKKFRERVDKELKDELFRN